MHRPHSGLSHELVLAVLPTVTVLAVLGLTETLSGQRLLFASLASSAFLIYLDPGHPVSAVGVLWGSQVSAALAGWVAQICLGPGYTGAAVAMGLVIICMVALRVVHPPAVSTALSFALARSSLTNFLLFVVGVAAVGTLVVLQQRVLAWLTGTAPRSEGNLT